MLGFLIVWIVPECNVLMSITGQGAGARVDWSMEGCRDQSSKIKIKTWAINEEELEGVPESCSELVCCMLGARRACASVGR